METIKSSSQISHIFEQGRRYNTPHVTILALRNEEQHDQSGRVAFIAGKKLGGAVWRNRAKRRMRALCFDLNGPFPGWDVVFIARRTTGTAPYDEMKTQVENVLVKARIASK